MKYITRGPELEAACADIASAPIIGLDLETTALDPRKGRIRLMQVNSGREIYVIDGGKLSLAPVVDALSSVGIKIIHGGTFEQKWLMYNYGCDLGQIFDTFRSSAIIHNGRHVGSNLFDVCKRELGIGPWEDMGRSDWTGDLSPVQLEYAAKDVEHLFALRESLRAQLITKRLVEVAQIEFQVILPEAEMELNGLGFDREHWLRLAEDAIVKKAAVEKELGSMIRTKQLDMFGEAVDIKSPKKLLAALHDMGLYPKMLKGAVLVDSTNETALAMLDHPVAKKLIEYRHLKKRVESYGPDYISDVGDDGRIRCHYWPFTGAGRYSTSDYNLAQIPRDKEYRKCFIGDKLVVADYSQIELRIIAQMSKDPTMLRVYRDDGDIHATTAAIITGKKDVTKEERQAAKAVNFGFCYGMGAKKLVQYAAKSYGVKMSEDQALQYRTRYFNEYRGVKMWHRQVFGDANRMRGVTRTIAGRLRYLASDKYSEWANTPVQGTGADMLKRALRLAYDYTKGKAKVCHSVYDEILLEAKPSCEEECKELLSRAMVDAAQPMLPDVPVRAEASSGKNWAEAK